MGSQASLAILVPRRTNRLNIVNIRSHFIYKNVSASIKKSALFENQVLIVGYVLLIVVPTMMNNTNINNINMNNTNLIYTNMTNKKDLYQHQDQLASMAQIGRIKSDLMKNKFKIFLKLLQIMFGF